MIGQSTAQVHKLLDNIDSATIEIDVGVDIHLSSSGCILNIGLGDVEGGTK